MEDQLKIGFIIEGEEYSICLPINTTPDDIHKLFWLNKLPTIVRVNYKALKDELGEKPTVTN